MSRPNVPETGPAVRKRALITGVAGQDGVYLARHLLTLGYDVVGTVVSVPLSSAIIDTYLPGSRGDRTGYPRFGLLGHILDQYRPDEIYNLASWSSVARSWSNPAPSRPSMESRCWRFSTPCAPCATPTATRPSSVRPPARRCSGWWWTCR